MNWQLLGNKSAQQHPPSDNINRRYIVFNQGYPQLSSVCRIQNSRVSGQAIAFLVSGELPFLAFEQRLNHYHKSLQESLSSEPSSGLCALFALREQKIMFDVVGMNLLPDLSRPAHLPPRAPLPCYFHNWLGERRMILNYAGELNWPEFQLATSTQKVQCGSDPYSILMQLWELPRTQGSQLIEELSALHYLDWVSYATTEYLRQAEPIFYLSRGLTDAANWWLFDQPASLLINHIRYQIALAQQSLATATTL